MKNDNKNLNNKSKQSPIPSSKQPTQKRATYSKPISNKHDTEKANLKSTKQNQVDDDLKPQPSETTTNKNKNSKQQSDSKFVRHLWWVDALLFILGTIILGGLATLLGGKMFSFEGYKMPPGIVPKIVFPIAWSIIYIAIGVSTFLMWRDKEIKSNDRKLNLIFYFVHMFFNVLWPLFFFRLNLPIVSVIWLFFVLATALVVMYRYFVANLPAGIIFTIYTLWLVYALYLNLGLVLINF